MSRTDTCIRADSTTTCDPPSDAGGNYIKVGTPGILSNALYSGDGSACKAMLTDVASDVVFTFTLPGTLFGSNGGAILRYQDSSNFAELYLVNNFCIFGLVTAGSETFPSGTNSTPTFATNDVIEVTVSGNDYTAKRSGTTLATTSTSSFVTSKSFGFFAANGNFHMSGLQIVSGLTGNLTIESPVIFQVFQRDITTPVDGIGGTGDILIEGTNTDGSTHSIEASIDGTNFTTIASSIAASATFTGTLSDVPVGTYTLTVRFVDDTDQAQAVSSVGVGEVFLVAGQSNSPGGGVNLYEYTTTNSLVGGGYETEWVDLHDRGAVWQFAGSNLMGYCGCPVAFLFVTHGGTAIANWVPGAGAGYYDEMVAIVAAAKTNGIRAVLWWQGESNQDGDGAGYSTALQSIATGFAEDISAPLMPCVLQHLDTGTATQPHQDAIADAITDLWLNGDNIVEGPDLRDINCEPEDTVHLIPMAKLVAAGAKWWVAIYQQFFQPSAAVVWAYGNRTTT